MFYALTHRKIEGGIAFVEHVRDVETLNRMALQRELDMTKASFHAFGHLRDDYCLLHAGSALGNGCGPLVVARHPFSDLEGKTIAIPGKMTTAYLLMKLCAPEIVNVVEMPFDRIMNAVSLGTVDAGLVIHEGRFTYPRYHLVKIADLGEWWEKETRLPVPLGGILARRRLGVEVIQEVDLLLKESIKYAFQHRAQTWEFIKKHAQELEDEVISQHIDLYVNEHTLDLGEGALAVEKLLQMAEESNVIPESNNPIFID